MKRKVIAGAAILGLLMAAGCLPPGGGSTEQEISVQQGGATVSSGSGEYFFGEGVVIDGEGGKTSSAIAFTVLNQGGKALGISGVSLSSGDTGDFDLDASALAGTIGPYSSSSFTLRFDPLVSMTMKTAVVTIQNSDADEGAYTFAIKGIGMRKLAAADGASCWGFGISLAVSGDTAVIGAASNAAYIFYRNPPGGESWQEVKKLTGGESFGDSVAISGDVVVVGAPDADMQEGAAFVYYRNAGGIDNWGFVKKCIANDRDGWDNTFANALALSGDTLVIGARRDTTGGVGHHGSAYVCYRNQGGADNWGVVKKIRPGGNTYNDNFATSVALSGDTLAAAAPTHGGVGAAYLFSRNSGGTDNWGQVKELAYPGSSSMPRFGLSVALTDEILAVGAPFDEFGTGWQGSVYLFYRDQGGTDNWGGAGQLVDREGMGGDCLGEHLSLVADTLLAGAASDTYGSSYGWGSLCAFARNQGGLDNWGQTIKLVPADGIASGFFGSAVGSDGTMILVGADCDTVGSHTGQGSVYALKF